MRSLFLLVVLVVLFVVGCTKQQFIDVQTAVDGTCQSVVLVFPEVGPFCVLEKDLATLYSDLLNAEATGKPASIVLRDERGGEHPVRLSPEEVPSLRLATRQALRATLAR